VNVVESFAERFASVDPRLVAIALLLQAASFCLRSLAWRNILAAAYPDRRVAALGVAAAYGTGIALNAFVPARGGDVAKIALVRSRIPGSTVPTVIGTIGVLSVFDTALGVSLLGLAWATGLLAAPPAPPSLPGLELLAGHPWLVGVGVLAVVLVVALIVRRFLPALGRVWQRVLQGGAVVRSPRRYATTVVPVQLASWCCRIGAAYALLAAFHIPATLPAALLVVVVGGIATASGTPGGVGTQQLALAYALHATASTASIVSFSIGMQLAVMAVNVTVGLTALMLTFRTLRPVAAVRAGVGVAGRTRRRWR